MPMITINRPTCTRETHEALKSDRARFVAETVPNGWQMDMDGSQFEMRRHRACGSTLSDGTRIVVINKEVVRVA